MATGSWQRQSAEPDQQGKPPRRAIPDKDLYAHSHGQDATQERRIAQQSEQIGSVGIADHQLANGRQEAEEIADREPDRRALSRIGHRDHAIGHDEKRRHAAIGYQGIDGGIHDLMSEAPWENRDAKLPNRRKGEVKAQHTPCPRTLLAQREARYGNPWQ
jgi:hypothetical protein